MDELSFAGAAPAPKPDWWTRLKQGGARTLAAFDDVLWALRAPLIVGLISFAILYLPAQIREIYRVLAADFVASPEKALFALLGVSLLSYFLWALCRALSVVASRESLREPLPEVRALSFIISAMIALLPIAAVILAIWGVIRSYEFLGPLHWSAQVETLPPTLKANFADVIAHANQTKTRLVMSLLVLFAIAGGLIVLFVLGAVRDKSWFRRGPYSFSKVALAIAVTAALIALAALQPYITQGNVLIITRGFITLGTIFIISVFLILLAYFTGAGTRLYDRWGFPMISALVTVAFFLSYFNLNDNHRLKFTASASGHTPQAVTQRFIDWFEALPAARKRLYAEHGSKYPVYIVSAQGGGLYAANLAAITLARLYTACPALKYHIFAISGVSGGSLGAGLFDALWAEQAARGVGEAGHADADPASAACAVGTPGGESALERRATAYLASDFLAPLAAGALFPDFLQRFIAPSFGELDRARAFEAGLSEAWRTTFMGKAPALADPFTTRFLDFSDAIAKPPAHAPMLVLNTTNVESGQRYLTTPVIFRDHDLVTSLYSLDPGAGAIKKDISLGTGIGLSSRFPVVMPAGVYNQPTRGYRFVDGGYFENSAIETAMDMKRSIEESLRTSPAMKVHLAQLGTRAFTVAAAAAQIGASDAGATSPSGAPAAADAAETSASVSTPTVQPEFRIIILSENYVPDLRLDRLNELGAPLRTLNRTRLRRGEIAKARAEDAFARRYVVELQHTYFPMPLGWQLSPDTQAMIKMQIGQPGECVTISARRYRDKTALALGSKGSQDEFWRLARRLNFNRCALFNIITELAPKEKEASLPTSTLAPAAEGGSVDVPASQAVSPAR